MPGLIRRIIAISGKSLQKQKESIKDILSNHNNPITESGNMQFTRVSS